MCNPTPPSRLVIDSPNACNQGSVPILCTPLHGPVQFSIHRGVRLVGHVFPIITPWGSSPHVTLLLGPSTLIISNGISIGSAVFVWVANAMLYNALSVGKKIPKTAPSPWDFVTLPDEDRAMAIGNMHQKYRVNDVIAHGG